MPEMKIKSLIKVLPFTIILLICSYKASSQVVVERSKDKVVISGVTYYIHQVRKGETAYSIAKAYGITVEELTKENPPAVYGINTGQVLRIPLGQVGGTAATMPETLKTQHNDSKFIYHRLKPGETVYFLSRTYGVSENEIIESNPGIDITKLSVGTEIAIPRKAFMSEQGKLIEPESLQVIGQTQGKEKGYIYHKVQSGESLSSIAEQYGLSVREIRKANKDLRFPQVGDYVKVPGGKEPKTEEIILPVLDTVPAVAEIPAAEAARPTGFTPVKNLNGSLNVAVLLPFYLRENSIRTEQDSLQVVKGKKTYKVTKRDDDWIYPASLDFVEMYEGILLAADTLSSLGLNINLYSYDIKSDTIELTKIIRAGKLEGMDLIIGPVYSHNLSLVAAYARDRGIPVVSPVPLFNNSLLADNPLLFMSNSSLEIAEEKIAQKISEFPDNNIVFIHSDTLGIDEDVKRFRKLILSELSTRIPYDEIKFREFLFYSRSMFNNDSINRLSHALSDQSKNIVIIASEDAPVISETLIDVHSLARKYDIRVFGYPAMRDMDNLDTRYLFDLDIMIYSPYWIDHSREDVTQFDSDFRKKFLTEPTEKSYAWQGYDLAYYFMSGLSIHGREFIQHPQIHRPDLLQTDYDFMTKSAGSGFENHRLFLVRFTKDYEVKLEE
jgi:LysM repeat protein